MFQKLKDKWDVRSDARLALIFLSFSLAGSMTIFVRKPIFSLLGYTEDTPFLLKAITYIFTVTPSYFILLIIIGSILGQFKFFWAFEKKALSRFIPKKKA